MLSSLTDELLDADHLKLITAQLTVRFDPDGLDEAEGNDLDAI